MRGSLKLLAYDNAVLEFVSEVERQRYGGAAAGTAGAAGGAAAAAAGGSTGGGGGSMPFFEKHWLGMSFQLAAFRLVGGVLRACSSPRDHPRFGGKPLRLTSTASLQYWCTEGPGTLQCGTPARAPLPRRAPLTMPACPPARAQGRPGCGAHAGPGAGAAHAVVLV
jgi:hypothetical protein